MSILCIACSLPMAVGLALSSPSAEQGSSARSLIQCARILNQADGYWDSTSGVDGNSYLSVSWGSSDFSSQSAFGNHCPDVQNPTSLYFKVLDGSHATQFQTGTFTLSDNVFTRADGLHTLSDGAGSVFKIHKVSSGGGGSLIEGNSCQTVRGNGAQQRTTFCIGNGAAYQAILGGINGDSYGNGNGPCICGLSNMCGLCEDDEIVEIYMSGEASWVSVADVAATGDPHLRNVHGERFDLMQPGRHVLVNIPRGERDGAALLRVEAWADKLGGRCDDIYFTELNVTGSWALSKHAGGYRFHASHNTANRTAEWMAFGTVNLKVVHARTAGGIQYLNFYVEHLGRAGFAVGGLLGEDDHAFQSTPPAQCVHVVGLSKHRSQLYGLESSQASIAEGTLE